MSVKLKVNNECDFNIHTSSSADANDLHEGIEIAATVKRDSTPINHKSKTYSRPTLKQIGCLSTLIMGQSGAGIDSIARREF